ncbi:MAG: FAD-binding protein [Saprospiraceae bacterium]|nr:FAD-binding protein [Saprospiraceae bacterium]
MNYQRIHDQQINDFIQMIGAEYVHHSSEKKNVYGKDHTEDLFYAPDLILRPQTTEEIIQIMKYCHQQNIPVTPRGAGTGLAGGALPICGGVLLSMERFDKILDIDEANLQVTVEVGVITAVLQDAVREKGLFYPPDPASRGTCYIGGNINTNSGGPRAVKYGVVKDYVLNLEVVLANGECFWTGANTLKNSTGYNLTQLMIGSEGTLGIITKAVLRLIPHPSHSLLLLAPFYDPASACAAVSAIFRAGITPSTLEFMERAAIDYAIRYNGGTSLDIPDDIQAHLLIEVDGNHLDTLYTDCEKIYEVLEQFHVGSILFADNETQKNELWKLRRSVGRAVKLNSIYKEEDTVVPRASLPILLKGVKAIGQTYGFESVCYGHAGDGNLHINILKGNLDDDFWKNGLSKGIREIFELVKQLKGTLSGEHGIGWVQRSYMDIVCNPVHIQLLRAIKTVFDPKGILNPKKILLSTDE